MNRPLPIACAVAAAVVGGLLFAPVFGLPPLLVPLGILGVVAFAAAWLSGRREQTRPWRPLITAAAGLLAVIETQLGPTTVFGLPTLETLQALGDGVTQSWQLTLQSTWPAQPDPELVLFVPLLVLFAAVLAVELLDRPGIPLLALAPSLGVAAVAQLYSALTPLPGAVAALAYAAVAGALLAATRPGPDRTAGERPGGGPARAAPAVVLAVVSALLIGFLVPFASPAYSMRREQPVPLRDSSVANPLGDVIDHLTHPDEPLFDVRTSDETDLWRLAVLETFDGVSWTSDSTYLRLGSQLAPDEDVTAPLRENEAEITLRELSPPWLPSQPLPASVTGLKPLVAQAQGTLLMPQPEDYRGRYTLSWWQPDLSRLDLGRAAVDTDADGGLGGVGAVPQGVAEIAEDAVDGLRPTFEAALVLERYLRDNYRLAVGENLPSGHSWPQLDAFLQQTKRGTTEQFAAAYVALARIRGIPARLAVGFQAPETTGRYTVRGEDVLAWPEVAVEGLGWVPLDPSGAVSSSGSSRDGLAAATERARTRLPGADDLRDPPVAPSERDAESAGFSLGDWQLYLAIVVAVAAGLALVWLGGVPFTKAVRRARRRRRPDAAAVVGAWEEVRDRLSDHGAQIRPGMTARDLMPSVRTLAGRNAEEGMTVLCAAVDTALWSGRAPGEPQGPRAWWAAKAVRRGLARRGWRARLRAAVNPRTLRRRTRG